MADDVQRALTKELTAQGFEVDLQCTGRVFRERYVCYLARGSLSKGYFGTTEAEALREAVEFPQARATEVLDPAEL